MRELRFDLDKIKDELIYNNTFFENSSSFFEKKVDYLSLLKKIHPIFIKEAKLGDVEIIYENTSIKEMFYLKSSFFSSNFFSVRDAICFNVEKIKNESEPLVVLNNYLKKMGLLLEFKNLETKREYDLMKNEAILPLKINNYILDDKDFLYSDNHPLRRKGHKFATDVIFDLIRENPNKINFNRAIQDFIEKTRFNAIKNQKHLNLLLKEKYDKSFDDLKEKNHNLDYFLKDIDFRDLLNHEEEQILVLVSGLFNYKLTKNEKIEIIKVFVKKEALKYGIVFTNEHLQDYGGFLHKKINDYSKDPLFLVSIDILFDFLMKRKDKVDYDMFNNFNYSPLEEEEDDVKIKLFNHYDCFNIEKNLSLKFLFKKDLLQIYKNKIVKLIDKSFEFDSFKLYFEIDVLKNIYFFDDLKFILEKLYFERLETIIENQKEKLNNKNFNWIFPFTKNKAFLQNLFDFHPMKWNNKNENERIKILNLFDKTLSNLLSVSRNKINNTYNNEKNNIFISPFIFKSSFSSYIALEKYIHEKIHFLQINNIKFKSFPIIEGKEAKENLDFYFPAPLNGPYTIYTKQKYDLFKRRLNHFQPIEKDASKASREITLELLRFIEQRFGSNLEAKNKYLSHLLENETISFSSFGKDILNNYREEYIKKIEKKKSLKLDDFLNFDMLKPKEKLNLFKDYEKDSFFNDLRDPLLITIKNNSIALKGKYTTDDIALTADFLTCFYSYLTTCFNEMIKSPNYIKNNKNIVKNIEDSFLLEKKSDYYKYLFSSNNPFLKNLDIYNYHLSKYIYSHLDPFLNKIEKSLKEHKNSNFLAKKYKDFVNFQNYFTKKSLDEVCLSIFGLNSKALYLKLINKDK